MNKSPAWPPGEDPAGTSGRVDQISVQTGIEPYLAIRDGRLHVPVYPGHPRRHPSGSSGNGPAIFLDRDGVIIEDVHYLTDVDQLNILPGVSKALSMLQKHFFLILATNQSGVARGLLTEAKLHLIHTELVRKLWAEGAALDAVYFCPHLPDAAVQRFRMTCDCRKPNPGMLLRAANDWPIDLTQSFMVGDSVRDMEAAAAAGVTGIMVCTNGKERSDPAIAATNLVEAAGIILDSTGTNGVANERDALPAGATPIDPRTGGAV